MSTTDVNRARDGRVVQSGLPRRQVLRTHGILVSLHTSTNAGYAIGPLEKVFYRVAVDAAGNRDLVHFTYRSMSGGWPTTLPPDFRNVAAFDIRTRNRRELESLGAFVREHRVRTVLGFDMPVGLPACRVLRKNGVRRIIAYWGAPMSSIYRPPLLWLRRLDCLAHRHKPDHYVFESEAMRESAIRGRGLPHRVTSVVRLGIDTSVFRPLPKHGYAHDAFGIPTDRCLVVYSGHMEPRKGVDVIVRTAVHLVENAHRRDIHFLLLGNRNGEESRFDPLYRNGAAREYITFGGYRHDMPAIFGSADIGVIASTGWDSFTMSSVEMASCGLPLVVSSLQGLKETVVEEETGFLFPPGSIIDFGQRICLLADRPELRSRLGLAGRKRVIEHMSLDAQVARLTHILRTFTDE